MDTNRLEATPKAAPRTRDRETQGMTERGHPTYVLGVAGIGQAPSGSGIYTIFSQQRWIYVGESDDIRDSLFRHLIESTPCMDRFGPLSFSFQVATGDQRGAMWRSLVTRLKPPCNTPNPALPLRREASADMGEAGNAT
jgi:hypothetical protein